MVILSFRHPIKFVYTIQLPCPLYTSILEIAMLVYVVAVIGFNQTTFIKTSAVIPSEDVIIQFDVLILGKLSPTSNCT